jgi:hypothetical protein
MTDSELATSLPGAAAVYSQTSFWDTDQSLPLSGINTPVRFSENEAQTDGSLTCQCGKGTFDCSIHPSTPVAWIAFMQDSLAKTLALLENKQVYKKEPDQGFTEKSCVSLAWYDPATCSWKTYQRSLVTDWEPYSETWPRWGMTRGTCAYAHPMSERRITEIDGLLFATPNTLDSLPPKSPEALHREATVTRPGRSKPSNLRDQVTQKYWPTVGVRGFTNDGDLMALGKMCDSLEEMNGMAYRAAKKKKAQYWPTPTAHNAKKGGYPAEHTRNTPSISSMIGGKLNPTWVEWLMGFPIGFTSLRDWVTRKSRSKPQPLGDYLEAAE